MKRIRKRGSEERPNKPLLQTTKFLDAFFCNSQQPPAQDQLVSHFRSQISFSLFLTLCSLLPSPPSLLFPISLYLFHSFALLCLQLETNSDQPFIIDRFVTYLILHENDAVEAGSAANGRRIEALNVLQKHSHWKERKEKTIHCDEKRQRDSKNEKMGKEREEQLKVLTLSEGD